MKIIFAGTPQFAANALQAIVEAGHEVVLVLTQPDRPSGRGLKLQPSEVKQYALTQGLKVEQPISLKLNGKEPEVALEAHNLVKSIDHDIMVVAAYGLILPKSFLDLPQKGAINIHGSLLPRWRGAAPIQRCIESGDLETGITIMEMDEGLDTGDILFMESLAIGTHNAQTLHDQLSIMGAKMIVKALDNIDTLKANKVKQPLEGMNYAQKLQKEEGVLNLHESAITLERKIRAFNPFPIATFMLDGEKVKIFNAQVVLDLKGQPGQIMYADKTHGLVVACGEHSLKINELQKGSKRVQARDFINGHKLEGKNFS